MFFRVVRVRVRVRVRKAGTYRAYGGARGYAMQGTVYWILARQVEYEQVKESW